MEGLGVTEQDMGLDMEGDTTEDKEEISSSKVCEKLSESDAVDRVSRSSILKNVSSRACRIFTYQIILYAAAIFQLLYIPS